MLSTRIPGTECAFLSRTPHSKCVAQPTPVPDIAVADLRQYRKRRRGSYCIRCVSTGHGTLCQYQTWRRGCAMSVPDIA
eukprot:2611601-Rhodomonas_salina.4